MKFNKLKINNISIKIKIFTYLLGFCSLLLILLWLFQIVFLGSFYKHIKINEIRNSAKLIMKNINNDNIQNLVENISQSNDVCVEIISQNGDILISSDILRDCIIHKMPTSEKKKLIAKTMIHEGELLEYFSRNRLPNVNFDDKRLEQIPYRNIIPNNSMIFSKIIIDGNRHENILLLNSVVSPVNSTVQTLRVQLYFVTAFMIIFSIVLAIIISKRVSSPIVTINSSAKILASGNYEVTFTGTGYKEINELSNTMNYAAKELRKVNSLQKELIANISHDLRTPLTLISGYAEAMRDLPYENTPENAQIIVDETKRLTSLVSDVLDISKLRSGTQSLNLTSFNLTQSIKTVIERFSELVKKDGYVIRFFYEQEIFTVADELGISQVFYNLLNNAINFTGNDKTVIIRQTIEENNVKIKVIDSGVGIPEEDLPYIWDRYYKVEQTHKRAISGTGLGLSIVKSTIELHGGQCNVESKVGEGSVFWFSLKI